MGSQAPSLGEEWPATVITTLQRCFAVVERWWQPVYPAISNKTCVHFVARRPDPTDEWQDKVVHHLQPENDEPLVLDRSREFRLKFHLGNLPLGWAWLIPAFHLREPTPPTTRTHTLRFPRSQLDFPLGPGQAVEEILVRLEEVPDSATDTPARLFTDSEERQHGLDDTRHEDGRLDGAEAAES